MAQTFTCPKCGAPQDYQGGAAATIQCPYCDTTLIVPPELRTSAPELGSFDGADWSKQASALARIKELIAQNKKIEAIKLYRETFGTGLKESKDAVEAIEHGHNVQIAQIRIGTPQSISASGSASQIEISPSSGGVQIKTQPARSTGCITVLVLTIVLVVIASMAVPLLLGAGLFTTFVPMSNVQPTLMAITTLALSSPTLRATNTPRPSPTPQFASVVAEFGGKGTGAGKMQDARAIAVDNNGNVFVAEYLGGRVQVFDANGKFERQCLVDPKAATPSIAADRRGNLFVLQGVTITQLDAATCAVRNVFEPAPGKSYQSLAVGADGNLYATVTGNQKDSIVRLNAGGRAAVVVESALSGQRDNFELDPRLALDGQGNFYVLGSFARQVFQFDRTGKFVNTIGSQGSEPGQFSAVQAIAIDSQGRIYVSDNQGVQVFAPDGRYLDVFDIPQSVASGMAFDDEDKLWIAARERVYQMKIGKK